METSNVAMQRLTDALQQIKGLVCGDRAPRWDGQDAVTLTRYKIADICDAVLLAAPAVPAPKEDKSHLCSICGEPKVAHPSSGCPVEVAAPAPAAQADDPPVVWWNGLRKSDERDLTGPSFSECENTAHDIPLYAHRNPAATSSEAKKSGDVDADLLRDVRPYVACAYECAFPDDELNASILARIDAAMADQAQKGGI